ncbi:MAG: discoidin domain-containing protein, partial [Oscillospiraceae bacterium]|nr:discoidin domain-containing protein [Oscillospiraceae bacterium]
VYYTVTEAGYAESIKLCAKFDAEDAAKSEPAEDVSFAQFSQPGSVSSSRFDEIYTTMTVNGLGEGDVVYVQGRASMPVAQGKTSVSIDRVLVKRAGGEIALQVKRAGKLISDAYNVATPAFAEPTATVQVFAENENGETLTGVRFEVVDQSGNVVGQMSTTSDSGAKAEVALGTYSIRNTESPEGYGLAAAAKAILRIEGEIKVLSVTIPEAGEEPEPTDPTDPTDPVDPTDPTDPPVVVDPADDSRDIPLEVLTVSTGNFEPNGGASEGPAELAVDNNHSTIWHTDWYGESRDDHWFQFEIDGEYNVDGLRILPRQAGNTNGIITEYDIQVSEDGETWKSVATGNWEADREWKLVSFGAEHVKFVRMYALDGVTDNAYVFASAAEIRITGEEWVAPPEEWNLGLESKIIAYNGTKLGDDAGPEKLFNGSWSDEALDKWCEDGKDLWVAFDLGGEASVSSISIYHAGANNEWMPAGASTNTEAYELYVLNTAEISVDELMGMSLAARTDLLESSAYWTPIASVTGNTDDITTHELELTGARIFKFNVSDTDTTNWASCVRVYEIEVMGTITGSGGGTTPEPGAADKSALNALIDLCEMYEKGNYTDESWNAFQAALTAA